ncbi:hypothetical protein C3K47_00040 [Solitalea longa]|uniref:Uncharacterized protein n=1 Tax=Solitalea longa TaxID=2079460 RepID=A0A2S5A9F1_9SPHI|nr:hypothetical protein C3K47_00040 [Solitalea longa]
MELLALAYKLRHSKNKPLKKKVNKLIKLISVINSDSVWNDFKIMQPINTPKLSVPIQRTNVCTNFILDLKLVGFSRAKI